MRINFEMAFWKLCKNGNLIKDGKGKFVDRLNYDEVVRENRFLKKDLTLDRFALMFCYLLKNLNLTSEQELAVNILFNSNVFFLNNLIEENKQITTQDKTFLKEDSL